MGASATDDRAFRLQTLQLESFRGFSDLTIEMPGEGPAVFIGINGSGKSSILDAIAMQLSLWVGHMADLVDTDVAAIYGVGKLNEVTRFYPIEGRDVDILEGKERADVLVRLSSSGEIINWALRSRRGKSTLYSDSLVVHAESYRKRLDESELNEIPVLCYYRATRGILFKHDELVRVSAKREEFAAYLGAFSGGAGPFGDFANWFRDEEDAENEKRLRVDNAYRNPRLETIRRALQCFLNQLDSAHYTNLRMERLDNVRGGKKVPELVIDKNGRRLSIAQLSEGEKNTLLLVADLASRFGMANPSVADPLAGPGIVLIDEIDLHLHPTWQRALLPALGKTFPHCQFIVTTHSPQVLSRVPKNNVFILENFELVKNRPHTYGRDANSILGEVMGVPERPKDIEDLIQKAARLVDEEKTAEAKAALKDLADAVGDDDHAVVRIRTLMTFLGSEE